MMTDPETGKWPLYIGGHSLVGTYMCAASRCWWTGVVSVLATCGQAGPLAGGVHPQTRLVIAVRPVHIHGVEEAKNSAYGTVDKASDLKA